MREKKTALKFFTVCQYQQEEDYLSTMHAQGMIPLIVMFVLVILPQFAVTTLGYGGGGGVQEVLSVCFLLLAMLYLVIFGVTAFQFYQYEKKIWPEKTGIKYKYCGIFGFIVLIVLCRGLFLYFGWTLRD